MEDVSLFTGEAIAVPVDGKVDETYGELVARAISRFANFVPLDRVAYTRDDVPSDHLEGAWIVAAVHGEISTTGNQLRMVVTFSRISQ